MRTTKRIIIRIIVAVAVAVILSKLKLLNIIEVSALTRANVTATQFCVYTSPSQNPQCDSNLATRSYFGGREFKSYTYNGDANFHSVSFLLSIDQNIRNKSSYWSGVFMFWGGNTSSTSTFPIRAYLDTGSNSYACNVESGTYDAEVGNALISTISCDNVVVLNETPRLYITGPFANYSSLYAVNKWAAIYDDDNLVAQQQANQYLNDLKTILNNNNNKLDTMIELQRQQNQTQTQIQNNTKETNDLIKSDDTTESNAKGKEFFDDFDTGAPQGLSGIISSPLRLITSLSSSSCSPLTFPLPFVNQDVSLACMSSIYSQFPTFYNLWQLITTGLIGYWVCINLFRVVKGLQNPDDDRIEVLDL